MDDHIGGISLSHVIRFQTRIMFGSQYRRIEHAKHKKNPQNELLIACLRMGWNDAFRHVSKNLASVENEIQRYNATKYKLEDEFQVKRKKITHKTGKWTYDDYYCAILNHSDILDTFTEYASLRTTEDRCDLIKASMKKLSTVFGQVKEQIHFGHIQKLFNMAVKLYLCLYMCRSYLELNDELFIHKIVTALGYADAPIDSIILDRLEQKHMKQKGIGSKHELLYPNFTWSQIDSDETIATYQEIQNDFRSDGKSSLYFDFTEWN
jgi:hypothetical protein